VGPGHDAQGHDHERQHQKPLEHVGPGHGLEPAAQGVGHDDERHDHRAHPMGNPEELAQHLAAGQGLQGQVRHGEHHHDQGEERGQSFVFIDALHQFGRGDQIVLAPGLPDALAHQPEGERHEAGAEGHDGEEGKPVAVARARGAENGEGAEVGGGHGAQQDEAAQGAAGQEILRGAVLETALGQKPEDQHEKEIGDYH
jgi:hypothetical protein